MFTRQQLYIGGKWIDSSDTSVIDVYSPHDQSRVAQVPLATTADADRAVMSASAALTSPAWALSSGKERAGYIRGLSAGLQARATEISELITAEMGSPASFSLMGQALAPAMVLDGFAELAEQMSFDEERPGIVGPCRIQKVPVGVCVGLIPWNAPLFITCMKLGAALASGATMVLKPPHEAPANSFILADVLCDLDLPPGVVNIVPGGAELGWHLVSHPDVDKVSFTGSTGVGRAIGAECGKQLKRCTLELGGKSAGIILDDADLATSVPQLLDAVLQNSGQVCAAQSRILVPAARQAEIVDAFAAAIADKTVGDPRDPNTDIGPLVSARQRDRVEALIATGVDEGAHVVIGGGRPRDLNDGWYVEPTLFDAATNAMRISREEIFGPVITVLAYEGDDEAVALANDSDYGLSGSVWTSDPDRGAAIASRLQTGTCAVNSGVVVEIRSPFGGFKSSGIGREMGPEGVEAYLETRTIVLPPG